MSFELVLSASLAFYRIKEDAISELVSIDNQRVIRIIFFDETIALKQEFIISIPIIQQYLLPCFDVISR
jgi:hypothetical protein